MPNNPSLQELLSQVGNSAAASPTIPAPVQGAQRSGLLDIIAPQQRTGVPLFDLIGGIVNAPGNAQASRDAAAQKQQLIQQIGEQAGQGTHEGYLKAAALVTQLDPDAAKTLIPQLMDRLPELKGKLSFADTGGQTAAQTEYGSNPRQLLDARLAAEMAMKNKELAAAKSKEKPALTPGQEMLDKTFAKEVSNLDNQGGFATIDKSLKQLDKVKALLSGDSKASGPIVGLLPKAARDVLIPQSGKAQDAIQDVVMSTLRPILGAQFTEEEGKRVVANTFNERLSPKENLRRLELLQETLKEQAAAKKASVDYFKKNGGSLAGYAGPQPASSVDEIQSHLAQKAGVEIKQINGKTYQKVNGGWALVK